MVYLVCTKRGVSGKNYSCKAKFNRKEGKVYIDNKCNNENNNHNKIGFIEFQENFNEKENKNINMDLSIYHRYFIQCYLKIKYKYI